MANKRKFTGTTICEAKRPRIDQLSQTRYPETTAPCHEPFRRGELRSIIDNFVDIYENLSPSQDVDQKPNYSYSELIFLAILRSPNFCLPIHEIYRYVQKHRYFNSKPHWKNAVRHSLTKTRCFRKIAITGARGTVVTRSTFFWSVTASTMTSIARGDYRTATSKDSGINTLRWGYYRMNATGFWQRVADGIADAQELLHYQLLTSTNPARIYKLQVCNMAEMTSSEYADQYSSTSERLSPPTYRRDSHRINIPPTTCQPASLTDAQQIEGSSPRYVDPSPRNVDPSSRNVDPSPRNVDTSPRNVDPSLRNVNMPSNYPPAVYDSDGVYTIALSPISTVGSPADANLSLSDNPGSPEFASSPRNSSLDSGNETMPDAYPSEDVRGFLSSVNISAIHQTGKQTCANPFSDEYVQRARMSAMKAPWDTSDCYNDVNATPDVSATPYSHSAFSIDNILRDNQTSRGYHFNEYPRRLSFAPIYPQPVVTFGNNVDWLS